MENQSPHLLLRVPTPTQQHLSFCDPTPRDLGRWIAALPKANLGEMARQLYQSLVELNQLVSTADNRLQLLELLRPEVYFVCKHLERHFLNQAIVLDERPRKVANLCQALQNHLAVGYKLVIAHEAAHTAQERAPLLTVALQRAIHCLCGPLIRANQLYCPVPEGLWLELHQLYQLACSRQVQQVLVRDSLALYTPSLSAERTYLVALLLGCARCNQMRQSGIARLAEVLEPWSALVRLQGAHEPSSLFAVPPQVDGPPRYTSLFPATERHRLLGLDPQALVEAIDDYLRLPVDCRSASTLQVPQGIDADLLQHLSDAWGDIAERTFVRNPAQNSLTLCIGMTALHYHLAGKTPFKALLKSPQAAQTAVFKDTGDRSDAWANAFDARPLQAGEKGLVLDEIQYHAGPGGIQEQAEQPSDSLPVYELSTVNQSPGGYCLFWPKEVPGQLQAGELLGIQDAPDQGWRVALVRWIRQVRGGGTQMGVELIAPRAQPCGLQLVRKAEQSSQFLRALLLPAIHAISRPATLITPRIPFQEGNKVLINLNGQEQRAVLSRRQSSTASFSQFEYRSLNSPEQPAGTPVTAQARGGRDGEEDFDSLWKSL